MKHKVCINIAKPGVTPTPAVRSGTVQIRKRLLDFLFGQHVNVLVLSPHDKRMNDCLPPILFSAIFKLLKVLPDTELDAC